jgi:hypothetical protein
MKKDIKRKEKVPKLKKGTREKLIKGIAKAK